MNKKLRIAVISLLSVVLAVSVGFLVKDYCDSKKQAELYDNLIETVEDTDGKSPTVVIIKQDRFVPSIKAIDLTVNTPTFGEILTIK